MNNKIFFIVFFAPFLILFYSSFSYTNPLQSGAESTLPVLNSVNVVENIGLAAIQPLNNGDTLVLNELPSPFNMTVVSSDPANTGSVGLQMSGCAELNRVENYTPYTVAVEPRGFATLAAGNCTLTATPYELANLGGAAGTPLTVNFTVADVSTPEVIVPVLTSINIVENIGLAVLQPLNDGNTLVLDELPSPFNMTVVSADPANTGSVGLQMSGCAELNRVENYSPYTVAVEPRGFSTLAAGNCTLTATPYELANLGGVAGQPLTLNFNVVDTSTPIVVDSDGDGLADNVDPLPTISTQLALNEIQDILATVADNQPLIITRKDDAQALDNSGVTLRGVLDRLAQQSGVPGVTGLALFEQFLDLQNRGIEGAASDRHCDDETLVDGTPSVNGYPYECISRLGKQLNRPQFNLEEVLDGYTITALVNRMDLRADDYSDCGEQRIIFSDARWGYGSLNHQTDGDVRWQFVSLEARIPNYLGTASGCQALPSFWANLAVSSSTEQSDLINQFLLEGYRGQQPIIQLEHFAESSGRINTSIRTVGRGSEPPVSFKSHYLDYFCQANAACDLQIAPAIAKNVFFPGLFKGDLANQPNDLYSQRATDFQAEFIANIGSLLTNKLADIRVKGSEIFMQGDDHIFTERYNSVLKENTPFYNAIEQAIAGKYDASGNQLTVKQILNRATSRSCAGCHITSDTDLNVLPVGLGATLLPNGTTVQKMPLSLYPGLPNNSTRLAHLDRDGSLSPAMNILFLPARYQDLLTFLGDLENEL